jgi:hypothetical protein
MERVDSARRLRCRCGGARRCEGPSGPEAALRAGARLSAATGPPPPPPPPAKAVAAAPIPDAEWRAGDAAALAEVRSGGGGS